MLQAPIFPGRSFLAISHCVHPESSADLETVQTDSAFLIIIPHSEDEGFLAMKN